MINWLNDYQIKEKKKKNSLNLYSLTSSSDSSSSGIFLSFVYTLIKYETILQPINQNYKYCVSLYRIL